MAKPAIADPPLQHETGTGGAVSGYETLARATAGGQHRLVVMVEGAHCAACIGKIESRLAREQDIRSARLNFTTRRLNLEWQGAPERANDFVAAVEGLGYRVYPYAAGPAETRQDEEKFLLLCLGVAGFALGNIMLLSIGLWTSDQQTMGIETRDFLHWMSAVIALPAILFSGRPFFRSAARALASRTTNMDVPISVALVLTCLISLFETIQHGEHAYFDSVLMLTFFLLTGRYLDFRARRQARSAAADLLGSVSGFASVLETDGSVRNLPVTALEPGMILRVAAGDKIPADGVITEGESEIDMALVTGETLPQQVRESHTVYAGTINLSAPIAVRVTKAVENTLLSDIIRLMEKAEQTQARYVRIADRVSRLYTPVVHILAAAAFSGWMAAGLGWQDSLLIAATVLIITCPCALALAVPVVQVLATGTLFRSGILVKSGDALERLAAIDTLLIDKTGTLTLGRPQLKEDYSHEILQKAASLASYSAHPLSRAIVQAYQGPLLRLGNVEEIPGSGLQGEYGGECLRLGRRDWCCGAEPGEPDRGMEVWFRSGQTGAHVLRFSDTLRADGRETIKALEELGIECLLLSGDKKNHVAAMAREAGIGIYHAEMSPVDKFTLLEELRKSGRKILMAGDGLNDAPALAAADVSISPATASGLAQNTADIVFMGEGLRPLLTAYRAARLSQKLVRENFALAVLYNIFAIPLAAAGMVTPLVAALAMSGSSLAVIANSFRLRRIKI